MDESLDASENSEKGERMAGTARGVPSTEQERLKRARKDCGLTQVSERPDYWRQRTWRGASVAQNDQVRGC